MFVLSVLEAPNADKFLVCANTPGNKALSDSEIFHVKMACTIIMILFKCCLSNKNNGLTDSSSEDCPGLLGLRCNHNTLLTSVLTHTLIYGRKRKHKHVQAPKFMFDDLQVYTA